MRARTLYFSAFALLALGSLASKMLAQSTSSYPTYVVDAQSPIVSTDGFMSPHGIAIGLDGSIYVADTGNHRVLRFDTFGNQSTVDFSALSPVLETPTGVALDSQGNLYVTDSTTSRLIKLAPGAKPLTIMKYPTVNQPIAVASDVLGNLAIVNGGTPTITARRAGGLPFVFNTGSTALIAPTSVAFDQNGILYVADSGNGTTPPAAYKFPKFGGTGTNMTPTGYDLKFATAVGVDPQLNVFLLDGVDNLLIEVPASGGTPFLVPQSNFKEPSGLAVDNRGNLYVSDSSESSNTVTRFGYHNAGHFGYRRAGVLSNPPIVVNYFFYATTEVTAIRGLGPVGPGGDEFVPGGGTCALNKTYTPESSPAGALMPADCTVWMRFRPAYPGGEAGAAQLSTSNGSMTQLLYGIGQGPELAVSFPTVLVNTRVRNDFITGCNGAGDCYIAEGGDSIFEAPGDGSPWVTFNNILFSDTSGLVVDPDGSVWTTNMSGMYGEPGGPGFVLRLDPPTGKVTMYPFENSYVNVPAIDSQGNLYWTDGAYFASISATSLGPEVDRTYGDVGESYGLTIDASNTFYTADYYYERGLAMFGLYPPEGQSNIALHLPLAYPNVADSRGFYLTLTSWAPPIFLSGGWLDVGPSILDLNNGAISPQDFAVHGNAVMVYLFNIGNQDLVFTNPNRPFTETGTGSGKFTFQTGTTCAPGGVLHPSNYCTLVISSNVTGGPNVTDTLHFLTNAVNNNSASFRMTGPPKAPTD